VRGACIDIGSNTTRLLVADVTDGEVHAVEQRRAFTHLRRALRRDGTLDAATVREIVSVVTEQLALARKLGAERVVAVATAAVRHARNPGALADAVERDCRVELRVLPEADEARLAFLGACTALRHARVAAGLPELPVREVGVADVGGGSSELVVGQPPDAIAWFCSTRLGSGDLADACLHGDPPTHGELERARARIETVLGPLEIPHPALAVAVGGSAASLRRLAGERLDGAVLDAALAELTRGTAAVVARRLGLDTERVRLLPAGVLILQAVHQRFGVPLELVGGGLREGVLLELAGGWSPAG